MLVLGFAALVLLVGATIGLVLGSILIGLGVALLLAVTGPVVAYSKSADLALSRSHATVADPVTHARLHNLVEGLCTAAGLPKPRLYVIDDDALNAFAVGRDPRHAALAVTSGLLNSLTRIELEGVLAHELSHIKSYDILVSTLATTLVGPAAQSGPGFVLGLTVPLAAKVMRATLGAGRETTADVSGVAFTRYPPGLTAALEKLRDGTTVVHSSSRATAHLWVASPLACVPEEGRHVRLNRLFDTYPPLEERIQALKEL